MNLLNKLFKIIKKPESVFQNVLSVVIISALLLVIPLIAKFTLEDMKWSFFDFVAAWILFFSAGITYRLIARKMSNIIYRSALGLVIATALFLVWSNLAVGLIGNEDNPANWMFIGVLAIGFLGAIITRLQAKGMFRVMIAMVIAHGLIVAIALTAGIHLSPDSSVIEILGVNALFATLWSGSALLFRNAEMKGSTSNMYSH